MVPSRKLTGQSSQLLLEWKHFPFWVVPILWDTPSGDLFFTKKRRKFAIKVKAILDTQQNLPSFGHFNHDVICIPFLKMYYHTALKAPKGVI